jgi:chromosome segregation ATPase
MSRNNIKALEEEINFLRITIQHFNKENIEMRNKIEDLKITLNSDKRMLQEYILQISDKDSTVMKLNNTAEQLKKRLENLQSQQLYTSRKNNRVSTPERDRTESNNTKSRVIGNISIKPNKEEQQRALSVLKPRKIPGELISNKIDLINK